MITTQEIKKYAELKKVSVEEHFAHTYIGTGLDFGDASIFARPYYYTIGIELSAGIWYWWRSFEIEGWNDANLSFLERYSHKTNKTLKGIKIGLLGANKIKKIYV